MEDRFYEYTIAATGPAGQEEIAVLQHSYGTHAFVAWHGITSVNRFWFWDVLWPYGAVSLVGLPGHGALSPYDTTHVWDWTPEHFIDVGIATLRAVSNGRPATLIGHSTGGMVALGIAQRAPELVQRLILIAPVIWSDLTGIVGYWQQFAQHPQLLQMVVAASLSPGRRSKRLFMASLRAFIADRQGFYGNARVSQAIGDGYTHMQQTALAAIAGTTHMLRQVDMRPQIQRAPTALPTLLIHGEADPIIPIAQAEWLAAALPNVQFARLPHVGHLPYAEQEETTNQLVRSWLQQHPLPAA